MGRLRINNGRGRKAYRARGAMIRLRASLDRWPFACPQVDRIEREIRNIQLKWGE